MLTSEQLQEIKERCEVATPGPIEIEKHTASIKGLPKYALIHDSRYLESCGEKTLVCGNLKIVSSVFEHEDAIFYANAISDIPVLLAHIDHQQRALEWIKEQGNSDNCGFPQRYAQQISSFFSIPVFAIQNILRTVSQDAINATKESPNDYRTH